MKLTNEKKKERKKEDGITLIALIITIIVMLILAGVSINAIIGDNGILNQAINAANATDIADTKEQIQIALLNYCDDSGQYTKDNVWSAVDDVLGEGSERDTENYTVQTAKGNTVDISDLIAGAYVYVDKKPPTVEIEVSIDGSTLTIRVTATDASGIDSYEYYLDSKLVESTTETTYEFTNLSDGSHTIIVVVTDTAGNETEKEVAVIIDTTAPTVAITTSEYTDSITVDVTAEDDNGISSYKYYLNGTLYETLTTESYTFTGLSSGTEYTIKVEVYDNSGNKTEVSVTTTTEEEAVVVAADDISENPTAYYGAVVTNYTVASSSLQTALTTEGIEWKIFYADDENIYLIASDYVPVENAPSSSAGSPVYSSSYPYGLYLYNVYSAYGGASSITDSDSIKLRKWNSLYYNSYSTSTNTNMKCVAYLLDTSLWSDYANTSYATYAVGGTTLEMWVASWNDMGYTTLYCDNINSSGYYVGTSSSPTSYYQYVTSSYVDNSGYDDTLYFPHQNYTDRTSCYGYWLASPSAYYSTYLMYVYYGGNVYGNSYSYSYYGFRPLVCLTSDIQLQNNSDGTYSIIQ